MRVRLNSILFLRLILSRLLLTLFCAELTIASSSAGVAYPDPPGGWRYLFQGDKDIAGAPDSGFTSLDGTWSHDNDSDQWDGSKIGRPFVSAGLGGNAPGGVMSVTEDGVTFLRMQDTGNPVPYDFPPPSNSKLFFGHNISVEGASNTVLDDGVTLTFRARLPTPRNTKSPLDKPYLDGNFYVGVTGAGLQFYYPVAGDGCLLSEGGKGNVTIKQASGGSIGFALTHFQDTMGGSSTAAGASFTGLTMNRLNGSLVSTEVVSERVARVLDRGAERPERCRNASSDGLRRWRFGAKSIQCDGWRR